MNVALAFVRLRDEQIRHMPSNVVFVTDGIASEDFLKSVVSVSKPLSNLLPLASHSCIDKCSVAVLSLYHRHHLRCQFVLVL